MPAYAPELPRYHHVQVQVAKAVYDDNDYNGCWINLQKCICYFSLNFLGDVHTVGKNIRLKYFLHGIINRQRSSNTVKEYPFYVTI